MERLHSQRRKLLRQEAGERKRRDRRRTDVKDPPPTSLSTGETHTHEPPAPPAAHQAHQTRCQGVGRKRTGETSHKNPPRRKPDRLHWPPRRGGLPGKPDAAHG